jgi:hypothetical protein
MSDIGEEGEEEMVGTIDYEDDITTEELDCVLKRKQKKNRNISGIDKT